jgi:hypothetical protein
MNEQFTYNVQTTVLLAAPSASGQQIQSLLRLHMHSCWHRAPGHLIVVELTVAAASPVDHRHTADQSTIT